MVKKRKTRKGMLNLKLFFIFAAFTVVISLIFGVFLILITSASTVAQYIKTEEIVAKHISVTILEEYKEEFLNPGKITEKDRASIQNYIEKVNEAIDSKAIALYAVDRFDNLILLCETGYSEVENKYQFRNLDDKTNISLELNDAGKNKDPEIVFLCNLRHDIEYKGEIVGCCYIVAEDIIYENIVSKIVSLGLYMVGMVAFFAFLFSIITSIMIVRPIGILTGQVANFDINSPSNVFRKKIRSMDEIQVLQEVFIELANQLKWVTENKIAEAAENERELTQYKVFKDMKEGLIPQQFTLPPETFTKMECIELITTKLEADSCNYFIREDGTVVFVVATMDDTGLMPTMHMVIAMAIIRSYISSDKSFEECVTEINRQIHTNLYGNHSLKAFFGMIDHKENKLYIINCGATPALFADHNKNLSHIAGKIYDPLGFVENVNYKAEKVDIADGDMIFVQNGKLDKNRNINGEVYDFEKFASVVENYTSRDADLDEILEKTENSVVSFLKEAKLSSEIIMLGVSYLKPDKRKAVKKYPPTMDYASKLQEFVLLQLSQNEIKPKVNALIKVILEEVYSIFCLNTLGKEISVTCEINYEKVMTIEMSSEVKTGKEAFDEKNGSAIAFVKRNVDSLTVEETENPKDERKITKITMVKRL